MTTKPPRNFKLWSKKEINFLKENYNKLTYHQLAEKMGRTFEATKSKAQRIGLAPKCLPKEICEGWRPNSIEKQVIMGSLLGDGGIRVKVLRVAHEIKQSQYLRWKASLIPRMHPRLFQRERKTTYKPLEKLIFFTTRTFNYLDVIYKEWYPKGKKIVPKSIWEIQPLGLAIWFQDDGSRDRGGLKLSTHSFSEADHSLLQCVLKEKWDVDVNIYKQKLGKKEYFYFRFRKSPARHFEDIIRPYIHPTMLYKLNYPELAPTFNGLNV